jgi:hypothetical protein
LPGGQLETWQGCGRAKNAKVLLGDDDNLVRDAPAPLELDSAFPLKIAQPFMAINGWAIFKDKREKKSSVADTGPAG